MPVERAHTVLILRNLEGRSRFRAVFCATRTQKKNGSAWESGAALGVWWVIFLGEKTHPIYMH